MHNFAPYPTKATWLQPREELTFWPLETASCPQGLPSQWNSVLMTSCSSCAFYWGLDNESGWRFRHLRCRAGWWQRKEEEEGGPRTREQITPEWLLPPPSAPRSFNRRSSWGLSHTHVTEAKQHRTGPEEGVKDSLSHLTCPPHRRDSEEG